MQKRYISAILGIIALLIVLGSLSTGTAENKRWVEEGHWESIISETIVHHDAIPAIVEQIWHPPVVEEQQVLVQEAYEERVFDHYLVNGEYTQAIPHEAVYETIIVVDQEAYDEEVLVKEAWNESVDPVIEEQEVRTVEYGYSWKDKVKQYNKAVDFAIKQVAVHGYNGYYITDHPECGQGHWRVHFLDDVVVEEGYNIEHPAEYETVHHDEVNHEEQVLVQEAYTEYVQVPYSGNGPYFGEFGNSADINAWANWIHSQPSSVGGWGSWVAYYNVTFHPAVYETVEVEVVPGYFEEVLVSPEVPAWDEIIPVLEQVWIDTSHWIVIGDTIVDDGVEKIVDEAGELVPTGNIVDTNDDFISA